jgi:hypothetical protein
MNTLKVTPKDFFLWAGAMVALYGSVIAFITLLFQYIEYAYPDPLSYSYVDPFSGGIRFAMASLFVLVPTAIVLMRLIRRDISSTPEKQDLWIRRWALYLTVFIAGVTVIGDLITLVNYFLGGELTMRFILKVLVIFVVLGAAFVHFLADIRGYWSANPGRAKIAAWVAGIAVVAAIVAGFFIMGSPSQIRDSRLDAQRVGDLQSIQWEIVNYWQQKEELPDSLEDLEDPISGFNIPTDPLTDEPYTYRATGNLTFELCATFAVESIESQAGVRDPYSGESENWQHEAGEQCFERTIDPERYPPFENGAAVRKPVVL